MRMHAAAIALIGALALALGACTSSDADGGSTQPVVLEPANPAAGCGEVVRYPDEGHTHVPKDTIVHYKTQPPTSGNHLQIWVNTGTYSKEIPDELQVHNLEHGHVIIQYVPGEISAVLLRDLTSLVKKNGKWMILAPRSAGRFDPPAALAFAAWRTMQVCSSSATLNPSAAPLILAEAKSFLDRYAKHGREKIEGQPIEETPPLGTPKPVPPTRIPSPSPSK